MSQKTLTLVTSFLAHFPGGKKALQCNTLSNLQIVPATQKICIPKTFDYCTLNLGRRGSRQIQHRLSHTDEGSTKTPSIPPESRMYQGNECYYLYLK